MSLRARLHRLLKRLPRLLAWSALALVLAGVALIILAYHLPLPERLAVADSQVVRYRDGTPAHVFLSPDDKWRVRVRLAEVDPAYVEALVRLEDKRFHGHVGVDPVAIARSAVLNLRRGEVVSGASTITMQLVRLLEPRPRTLRSKVIEAFRAVQLELRMSKEDILESYLRFVPYGRNIEGIEAAALSYFGHQADALSPAEIATLLAVPQGPRSRAPSPAHVEVLRRARDDIARRLLDDGALPLGPAGAPATPEQVLAQVKAARVPDGYLPFPRQAPHVAWWLRGRFPYQERIDTTLDRGLQQLAERVMARAGGELATRGVHNGAAVLVDHHSGEVRGLVGNFTFDDGPGSQIAGFDVARSPGSALKPFIYALAIDGGHALPGYLVPDTPVRYADYAPSNYDGTFSGLVRLDEALSRSLNIPFVRLLGTIGMERFLGALRTMGVEQLAADPGHYGLSAAVGGIEVTPLELAALYATLAQDGRAVSLRVLADEPVENAVQVLSPGAAWLTRKSLKLRDRPDFPARRALSATPPAIHWKTGTSFGNRDAWAAGSGPTYTAVVWTGNLDRTPSAALVGAEAAAPILFDLLEGVATKQDALNRDDPRPPDLVSIDVCTWSGYPAGEACPKTVKAWAPARNVPTHQDPYHVKLDVDLATGLAVTPECRGDRKTEARTFVVWPTSVRRYLSERHRNLPPPPDYAPGCTPAGHEAPPTIVSPPPRQTLLLIPGMPVERQEVPLAAESQVPGDKLSWFVNGAFIGTAAPDEQLWWTPAPGEHEIVVMDRRGRSASRQVRVR